VRPSRSVHNRGRLGAVGRVGLLAAVALTPACDGRQLRPALSPGPDLAAAYDDPTGSWSGPCDPLAHPCAPGQRCFEGGCVVDNGGCTTDEDCQNDSFCQCTLGGGGDGGACRGGACIPWGSGGRGAFDEGCTTPSFLASEFASPAIKCSYNPDETAGSLVTPIVADLDGDHQPEVVFASWPDGFTAIHAADCKPYFSHRFNFATSNQSQLAVADLDGDGVPEIVGINTADELVVFDNQGNLAAKSDTPFTYDHNTVNGKVLDGGNWGAPAIDYYDAKPPREYGFGGK